MDKKEKLEESVFDLVEGTVPVDESILEQYERKMDDIEGQIEAYDLGKRNLSEEIEELEHDEHIDSELDKLKARVSGRALEGDQGTRN